MYNYQKKTIFPQLTTINTNNLELSLSFIIFEVGLQ